MAQYGHEPQIHVGAQRMAKASRGKRESAGIPRTFRDEVEEDPRAVRKDLLKRRLAQDLELQLVPTVLRPIQWR